MIDKLCEKIRKTGAPIVVGLDPMLSYIPEQIIKKAYEEFGETLEGAAGILAAGRGIGGKQNFQRLAACAAALGAQAGATRPAVMNTWAEMERLIGQSGHQVSPRWMVTVGASGSGPFLAGVRAERLAAVDNDPNAMIFWNADLGIQADAGAFLDALEKELSGTP